MLKLSRRYAVGVVMAVGLLVSACSTTPVERNNLADSARNALQGLYAKVPAAKSVGNDAQAILVFPSVTQAGLFFGGQYGRGVMFKNGQVIGYYNITGGSYGLQAGAQTFSQGYFFMTPEALNTFQSSPGFSVGAGIDVAVANVGASGTISSDTLTKPLVVFVWGQQGLMAGVKVEGQKITKIADANGGPTS